MSNQSRKCYMTGFVERVPRQLTETPTSQELGGAFATRIDNYGQLVSSLEQAVVGVDAIDIAGRALRLGRDGELGRLLVIVRQQSMTAVESRVRRLRVRNPGHDPFVRWMGAQLDKLNIYGRQDLYAAADALCKRLPLAVRTPPEYHSMPVPEEEVLRKRDLQNIFEVMQLADEPDSVVVQLVDTIGLALYGVRVKTHPPEGVYGPNYDFTILESLSKILGTLKHKESELTFRSWLVEKLTATRGDAEDVVVFLRALVNTAACQDLPSLWKPPPTAQMRRPEVLTQPFLAMLNAISYAQRALRGSGREEFIPHLVIIESLVKLRFGQVYRGAHLTSLYTADVKALIPTPGDFAELALLSVTESILKTLKTPNISGDDLARALINLAESIGVENIGPLAVRLTGNSKLGRSFLREAQKAGLVPDPLAETAVAAELRERPWQDVAEIDFSRVIKEDTTDLEVYVFTGTFAPFTKGHKDLLERAMAYINSLPTTTDSGRRKFQRIVLITPITRVANIGGYEKTLAQIGPVDTRVGSILLQVAEMDRNQVFITTRLQPDPSRVRNLEERVRATVNNLLIKMASDLVKAGRVAGMEQRPVRYIMGPDELVWTNNLHNLGSKERQPEKVTRTGGVVVARWGYNHSLIKNHRGIARDTGIETVIIAPTTRHTSSTRVIEELARTGKTLAVEVSAQAFVARNWGREAIRQRERLQVQQGVPSVGRICQRLVSSLSSDRLRPS